MKGVILADLTLDRCGEEGNATKKTVIRGVATTAAGIADGTGVRTRGTDPSVNFRIKAEVGADREVVVGMRTLVGIGERVVVGLDEIESSVDGVNGGEVVRRSEDMRWSRRWRGGWIRPCERIRGRREGEVRPVRQWVQRKSIRVRVGRERGFMLCEVDTRAGPAEGGGTLHLQGEELHGPEELVEGGNRVLKERLTIAIRLLEVRVAFPKRSKECFQWGYDNEGRQDALP